MHRTRASPGTSMAESQPLSPEPLVPTRYVRPCAIWSSENQHRVRSGSSNRPVRCAVADLSNDPSYAETWFTTFGRRMIGLNITRLSDGRTLERRPVGPSNMLVYTIGRSQLLQLLLAELHSGQVRFVDGPESRRAYGQLEALETELRDSGIVYKCAAGQHDDLG